MKKLTALLVMLWAASLSAQTTRTEEYDFMMYLIGNGMKDDALVLAATLEGSSDTLAFAQGYAYYSARQLEKAVEAFARVGEGAGLRGEALLFGALSAAHLGRYADAEARLSLLPEEDGGALNLGLFERAGIGLLRRDLEAYDRQMRLVDTSDFRLSAEAARLAECRQAIASHRMKSPALAAGLSAVVPGLGKVYAGSPGEGIASLLVTGSLVAVTAENWVKQGPTNWKTVTAGLLSTLFYVAGISGSAATARTANADFNTMVDVQILYNIHIPLRNGYRH